MSISNIMQAVKEPVLAVAKPLAYVTAGGLSGTAFCVVAELIGQAISSSDTSSYNAYLPSDSQITNSFLADYSMGNSVVGGPIAGMITGFAIYIKNTNYVNNKIESSKTFVKNKIADYKTTRAIVDDSNRNRRVGRSDDLSGAVELRGPEEV